MRLFTIIFFSLIALIGGGWVYLLAPIANPAVEIGYYGYYNRVQRVIKAIPDVTIVDTWQHTDITLEDFGFTLRRPNSKPVKVDFRDGEPEMSFSSDQQIRDYVLMQLDRAPMKPVKQ